MRPNNDTVLRGNNSQSKEANGEKGNVMGKVAAGVAGVAAVAGGAYVAYATGKFEEEEELVNEQKHEEAKADEQKHEEQHEQVDEQKHEEVADNKHTDDNHEHVADNHHQQTSGGHHSSGGSQPQEEDYFAKNDVQIKEIDTTVNEDGDIAHVAQGTVNGHNAVFVDDGNGNVIGSVVDENDNNEIDEGEVHIFAANEHVNVSDLASHMVSTDDVQVVQAVDTPDTPEVHVVAVENDVDLNGATVNVAAVTVDQEEVVLIDTSQNGEVDLMIADLNHNDEIDDDEIADVTDQHFAMPTADDIDSGLYEAGNDAIDDSGSGDIDLFEV